MNRRIRVEPETEAELQGAAEWYEAQQDGLGLLLLQQAASVYQRITSGEPGRRCLSVPPLDRTRRGR